MTSEERFERIALTLDRIAEGRIELEAGQLSMLRLHARLEEALTTFSTDTKERIDKLTVLVDLLVKRDLDS